ncbi:tetratricopeptide repeat-containing sensor histidine kinase (plasmid) [Pseudoalteromonas sp. T1lg65]|uniref:tetratricopeptide repeat-containing sensor histidine kinase n=1 Tax=Pseudoalteromonas sp. T1lg65 TaxID=2077101 RepID=UPI003F7923E5
MKKFGLVIVVTLLFIPLLTSAKISDEAFSQMRSEVSAAGGKSPLSGIETIDNLLAKHGSELANSQTIRLLYLKSWYLINADRIESAVSTLAQARLLARDIDEPGILYSYYSISASAFSNVELYELALENNLKAYEEAPKLNRPEFISQTENNIGHVYLKLGLLDQARYYFQRFYNSAVELKLVSQQATGMNNLGEVAFLKGELEEALQLHEQALTIRRENGYQYHEAWSLYNLGRVYAAKRRLDLAEQYLVQAVESWENNSAFSKALLAKLELAKLHSELLRVDNAANLIEEIIQQSTKYNQLVTLKEALLLKSQLKRSTGDFAEALDVIDKFNAVTRQFSEKQASIGLAYMVSQTELQTKEVALKQLEQEHQLTLAIAEARRRQNYIIGVSAALVVLITWFFIYRINRQKRKLQILVERLKRTQDKLVESEKMRAMTTLVSGMAHQLNTPLGLVITANSTLQSQVETLTEQLSNQSLTQNQLKQFINESSELLQLSQKNSEKAADMIQRFKMMSAKLQMSELSHFDVLTYLQEKVGKLEAIQQPGIAFEITGESITITTYASVLLKVISQLIENSVKHGFQNTNKPKILLEVRSGDEQQIDIHYIDNGEGISLDKRKQVFDPFYTTRLGEGSLGLGLNIIYNSVVHIMQGQVECVEDSKGAHFVISLPRVIAKHTIDSPQQEEVDSLSEAFNA